MKLESRELDIWKLDWAIKEEDYIGAIKIMAEIIRRKEGTSEDTSNKRSKRNNKGRLEGR